MKLKIKAIWAIIRNREVAYNLTFKDGRLKVKGPGAVIFRCTFTNGGIDL